MTIFSLFFFLPCRYGPPGTGKTLLARAVASNVDAKFLKVVSSAIVDKYIGESARVIREMFGQSHLSDSFLHLPFFLCPSFLSSVLPAFQSFPFFHPS